MSDKRFRVVLTGQLEPGFSREAVIASLARFFETSAGTLIDLFDRGDHPVDAALSADEASRLQQRLAQMGARAHVEALDARRIEGPTLHLPQRDESVTAGLMTCPACGHRQLVARSCDECGVVFTEFNRSRGASAGKAASGSATSRPKAPGPHAGHRPRQVTDIHARDRNGWHDAWVDDGNELPTEQYHLNLFMGQSAATLNAACQRMLLGRRTQIVLSWTGGAVVSPFLWAMYRKMWAWGAVIFVAEVLLPVLLIALGTKPNISDKLTYLGIAGLVANRVFWPFLLKYLYCRHARRAIAYLNRMSPTFASDIDIASAGGTSRTSAFVGFVAMVVLSLLTWSLVDTGHRMFTKRQMDYAAAVDVVDWSAPVPATQTEPTAAPEPAAAEPGAAAQPEPAVVPVAPVNRWVVTRGRLRTAGQRLYAWMELVGSERNPAQLTMTDIVEVLALDEESRTDGWGRPIAYRLDGSSFVLLSAGPDGTLDSPDDIQYRRSLPQ